MRKLILFFIFIIQGCSLQVDCQNFDSDVVIGKWESTSVINNEISIKKSVIPGSPYQGLVITENNKNFGNGTVVWEFLTYDYGGYRGRRKWCQAKEVNCKWGVFEGLEIYLIDQDTMVVIYKDSKFDPAWKYRRIKE